MAEQAEKTTVTATLTNMGKGPRTLRSADGKTFTLERGQKREGVTMDAGEYAALAGGPVLAVSEENAHLLWRGRKTDAPTNDRAGAIRAAIESLGKDGFTVSGKPEVGAINATINADLLDDANPVTAAERDEVWAAMEAERAGQ